MPLNGTKIAYIEMNFPYVTTFMAAEMNHVRKSGVPITILPIKRNSFDNVQSIYHDLRDSLHYPPFFGIGNLRALVYYLRIKPVLLFSTLLEVVLSIRHPLKYVAQTWAILFKAIYCAKYVEDNGISHVHGNWAHNPTTIAYIVGQLTGATYSFSSHAGADIYRNPDMLSKKIRHSRFNMTCVGGNKDYLATLCDSKDIEKIHVIHHGVQLTKFAFRPTAHIEHIQQPYKILSVGNLHEAKGFQYMVDASRLLRAWGLDFEYWIVGQGYMRQKLQKRIRDLGLERQIHLKGQLLHKELLKLYNEAHLFVMPSIVLKNGGRDGIPNVLIEAMAVGVPSVGSDAAGIPDVIVDGETGLLAPPRNAEVLAEKSRLLLENPTLRVEIATKARRFVERHFDREKNLADMFQLFSREVLQ